MSEYCQWDGNYYRKCFHSQILNKDLLIKTDSRWQHNGIMWLALRSVKFINVDFLIRSTSSQSSSYPIDLTRLGWPCSRPNPHLKSWKYRETRWPLDQWGGHLKHNKSKMYLETTWSIFSMKRTNVFFKLYKFQKPTNHWRRCDTLWSKMTTEWLKVFCSGRDAMISAGLCILAWGS